jgi:hypothetical protein
VILAMHNAFHQHRSIPGHPSAQRRNQAHSDLCLIVTSQSGIAFSIVIRDGVFAS